MAAVCRHKCRVGHTLDVLELRARGTCIIWRIHGGRLGRHLKVGAIAMLWAETPAIVEHSLSPPHCCLCHVGN